MFKKLKDKLKNWTKKISEEAEPIEETKEEIHSPTTDAREGGTTQSSSGDGGGEKELTKESPKSEKQIQKAEKKELKKQKREEKKQEKKKIKLDKIETKLKKEIDPGNCKEPEKKFKIGTQDYQPDTEKLSKKESKKIKILDKQFDNYSEELEMLLLENNVAIEVVEKIIKELKSKLLEKEFSKKDIEKEINKTLKEIINNILIEPFDLIEEIKEHKEKPYVILFCGVNGSGKTTTVAKFANALKEKGVSCVMGAADTFRAAAVEQLKKHGENLDIKVISQEYGSDPAAVAFDTVKYAEKNKLDCAIIDTAGRMHTAKNLLKEMEKIKKVAKPSITIFTGESITGNDATEQIKAFHEAIGIDAIILSKADIDEKGGTALSVGYTTSKPIIYLGTGQEYKDIEPFDKEKFIEKLGL